MHQHFDRQLGNARKLAARAIFQGTRSIFFDILSLMEFKQQVPKTRKTAKSILMAVRHPDPLRPQRCDKQLRGIDIESVMEKRRLDQALNAKEFAVCAGVSYSTARSWFHIPGFPVFHGVIFWQDFVRWRTDQNGLKNPSAPENIGYSTVVPPNLPPRAAQILLDA